MTSDESPSGGSAKEPIDPFQVMRDPFDPELFNKYETPKKTRR